MCVCQFLAKLDNFDFFSPNLPKNRFRVAIQKTIVGIRISILDIPCVPIFSQNEQLRIFRSKFLQKKDLRHSVCQFSAKLDNFDFFGPNLPKKEIRI